MSPEERSLIEVFADLERLAMKKRRGVNAEADQQRLILAADLVRQVLCGPVVALRLAPANEHAEVRVCIDGVVKFLRGALVRRENVPLYFDPSDRERVLIEFDRQEREEHP